MRVEMNCTNSFIDKMSTSRFVADDRNTWHVFSDDPVMQRRLEAKGAEVVSVAGDGKHYKLRADQLLFRTGKRVLSETRKAQLAARMRALRSAKATA